jgi:signal transduction histidine kinase
MGSPASHGLPAAILEASIDTHGLAPRGPASPPSSRSPCVRGELLPAKRADTSGRRFSETEESILDAVLSLTEAESAGVSVLDEESGPRPELHRLATSGRFAPHLGVTLPRDRSPCGVVLQESATLLIVDPARTFPEVDKLGEAGNEVLLSPFQRAGIPVGTVCAAEIVGQLLEVERANGRLRLEAERYRRGQREMLATLAHELRNPLATISNAVAVIRRLPASEGADQAGGIVERQLLHMSRLLDALLDGVRGDHGGADLSTVVSMSTIVRDAIEISTGEIASRGHQVSLDLPNDDVRIRGNATQLVEIVVNLLSNAAKYTPPGGRIVLTLLLDSRDVILEVSDNGIGIASEMLAPIFHMFVQVKREAPSGGIGIGLAVVERLLGKLGGSIVATSDGLGKGSTFTVRIPLGTGDT